MVKLIISEKPSTALKIAEALADGRVIKNKYLKKIPWYEIKHGKNKIIVTCAVGHLYTVAEREKKGWTYPMFDTAWKPTSEAQKGNDYTKPYLNNIIKLCEGIDDIYIATDYDIEGEVIGYNIVRFACKRKDAKRMKFSTTTKEDLRESFEKALPHLDFKVAEAGLTRHELDYYYGINVSRALTLSIKNAANMFQILSSGRVQGPALKILADKEKEIQKFKPEPFWQIELKTKEIDAWHEKDKFWDKKEADKIMKKTKGKPAIISSIKTTKQKQAPPFPFDLTTLQTEAYKVLNLQPKDTLSIAQDLYVNSYISYPRTSSNQLPKSLGYKKILKKLAKQSLYKKHCDELLRKKDLTPNNGKKSDPAHPAIYPTGEIPKNIKGKTRQLYDLIVRRVLATFGEPATRETVNIHIDVNKENFIAKGTRTIEKGWHKQYGPYAKFDETELPNLKEKDKLKVKKIEQHEKETQPPKRFTPASIIRELEKKDLGTKATRSQIIESLFNRNYVRRNGSIEVTDLGLKTSDVLHKYVPEIQDPALTREFELDMQKIEDGKKKGETILKEARSFLTKVLKKFKENETNIGKVLAKATIETREKESIVGKCDKCGENLRIMYTRRFKSYFVACSGYPKCRNTFSIPSGYLPKPLLNKPCKECGYPQVLLISAGKRPWNYCINKNCPQKERWKKEQEAKMKTKKSTKKKTVKKKSTN